MNSKSTIEVAEPSTQSMSNQLREVRLPQTILVAVDAHGLSDPAVRAGVVLSRALGASLQFVHSVGASALDWEFIQDPRVASGAEGLVNIADRVILEHLRTVLRAAGAPKIRVEERLHVGMGRPARVVLERARELSADWVVLGALRKRPIFDFGSTARVILASAPAVWVQPCDPRPIRRILVPTDLSEHSLEVLAYACSLARRFDARVRVVHCFDTLRDAISPFSGYPDFGAGLPVDALRREREAEFTAAMASFDWRGADHELSFFDAEPVAKLLELEKTADLIAMSTHGRTGMAGAVLGHVAYSVLKQATIPVLAMHTT